MRDLHTRVGGYGRIVRSRKGAEHYQKSQWDVIVNKEARKQSEITMSCELRRRDSSKSYAVAMAAGNAKVRIGINQLYEAP